MNVSLTPELERYIRSKVATGLYNNASEVIREALRALLEREAPPVVAPARKPPMRDEVLAKLGALEKPLRARGLKSLAVFGSVVRGVARPDSDVDVLIDIEAEVSFSLIDLVRLKDFLEDCLGHKVDVVTRAGLDANVLDRVQSEAQIVF
jgi:putative addiction module CopG family antidote